MKIIKLKIHSVVDVITNSSTTIYTYQNGSVNPAKELINEMLKLANIDKKADDIFYFGVFLSDDYRYFESEDLPKDCPEWESGGKAQSEWMNALQLSIMTGEIEKPEWMKEAESDDYSFDPDSCLCLIPKEPQYEEFGKKIKALLNSISADGGYDG